MSERILFWRAGVDPTVEQWQEISTLMKEKKLFPFFDMAYQVRNACCNFCSPPTSLIISLLPCIKVVSGLQVDIVIKYLSTALMVV